MSSLSIIGPKSILLAHKHQIEYCASILTRYLCIFNDLNFVIFVL